MGIAVKCNDINDLQKLKKEAETKLMEYDVQISKMIKPRFKIVSYRGNLKKEDVETCLRDQNQFINDSEELKINFIKTNKRKRTQTIYGECNATLFKKFVNKGKVFLQWERYPIYEDLDILRCFKCQEFFHKSNNCPNADRCNYCSENHTVSECQKSNKKCINCLKANAKYGLDLSTDHETSDINCPTYQYHLNVLRGKIDYLGVYG